MPSPSPRAYLAVTLGVGCLVLLGAGAANLLVDPFGIWQLWRRPGVNVQKAGQHGHDRMVKAYQLRRQRPDVVLLGTSRVQYGMDPTSPHLGALGERPYNAGLLGSNIYLALRYLQHAQRVAPLNAAVVGLDPLMFDDAPTDAARDFLEGRLCAQPDGRPSLGLAPEDAAALLLSFDALRLSLRTVRRQHDLVTDLLPNGHRAPLALERYFAEAGSTRASFLATERAYLRDYAKAQLPRPGAASAAMATLAQLIRFAEEEHIRLELYFTPEHVRLRTLAQVGGFEPAIHSWRQMVAEAVAGAQARRQAPPDGAGLRLWNMAILGERTCEPVPPATAGQAPLTWFYESTHARDRLGELVMARMLAPTPGAAAAAIGHLVEGAALDDQRQRDLGAQAAWAIAHPQEAEEVARTGAGTP